MWERRNWEKVAVTVSSQPLTKTVSVSLGFHRCADWLKTGREWYCCRLIITPWRCVSVSIGVKRVLD